MAEVRWTDGAINDLREIVTHISEQYPVTAERVRLRIVASTQQLQLFPVIGARVPEFELNHMREIVVG
jgi:plasmid stabilization system protein ParE